MNGLNLANSTTENKRRDLDFYPTPPDATQALLDFLKIPKEKSIWECACGDGAMSEVIKSNGYDVVSTDLFDRGYGQTGCDFTTFIPVFMSKWIITNPPFAVSGLFIERAQAFIEADCVEGFAFLLKSQYWHAAKRTKLFEAIPPAWVLPLTWRPDFMNGERGGSPTMECLWTVWIKGETDTRYRLLNKPIPRASKLN